MTTTPSSALCPPCAARIGLVAPHRRALATCPACDDEWQHGRWSSVAALAARVRDRLAVARSRRRALIAAHIALFELGEREQDAGITWETEESDAAHAAIVAVEGRTPRWERLGVWHESYFRWTGVSWPSVLVGAALLFVAMAVSAEAALLWVGAPAAIWATWSALRSWAGADQ